MASLTDDVCLALTTLWQAVTGPTVVDGPQSNSEDSNEWVFVGYDADTQTESNDGATAEQDWLAFAKTRQETGEITSAIVVRSGDTDIPAARARAYAILSDCEDILRADHKLGGLVIQSYISDHRYIPMVTSAGCKVRVVFTVTYLAQL